MKRVTIRIKCPRCNGEGKIEAPTHLQLTLSCLESHRAPVTTREVIDTMSAGYGEKVSAASMCNRLNALVELGYVAKEACTAPSGGMEYRWRLIDAPRMWERVEEGKDA